MGRAIVCRWLGSFWDDKATVYAAIDLASRRTRPLDVLFRGVWCRMRDSPGAFEGLDAATIRSLPAYRAFKALVSFRKVLTTS